MALAVTVWYSEPPAAAASHWVMNRLLESDGWGQGF